MNKLKKINELAETIKLYGSEISEIYENIDIDLEHSEEDKDELFIRFKIYGTFIRFEIDKNGEFYIETSLNTFETLDEAKFWKIMYIESNG